MAAVLAVWTHPRVARQTRSRRFRATLFVSLIPRESNPHAILTGPLKRSVIASTANSAVLHRRCVLETPTGSIRRRLTLICKVSCSPGSTFRKGFGEVSPRWWIRPPLRPHAVGTNPSGSDRVRGVLENHCIRPAMPVSVYWKRQRNGFQGTRTCQTARFCCNDTP